MCFSDQENVDPFNPPIESVLKFLNQLYESGLRYSAINTAKSAISSVCKLIHNRNIGDDHLVQCYMRGIFNTRPSLPQYGVIWDVNMVFTYISSLPTDENISLLQLSEKLVMLFMLLSGQRAQTIHLIKLSDLRVDTDKVTIYFSTILKQTKPNRHLH